MDDFEKARAYDEHKRAQEELALDAQNFVINYTMRNFFAAAPDRSNLEHDEGAALFQKNRQAIAEVMIFAGSSFVQNILKEWATEKAIDREAARSRLFDSAEEDTTDKKGS